MKTRWLLLIACVLITACDNAKKTTPESTPETETASVSNSESESVSEPTLKTPMAEFEAIKSDFEQKMADFSKAYRAASEEERKKLVEGGVPQASEYADRVFAIAKANAGTDVACKSLLWVASNDRSGDASDKAYDVLFKDHLDSESLKDVCMSLGYSMPSAKVEERLRKLVDNSPHDSVKAMATFSLAKYLNNVESAKKSLANSEESRFDDDTKEYVNSFTADPKAVESLYESLIANYPDLKPRKGSKQTFKDMAGGALFEINNLSIGKVAPDIEGEDLDGKSFKLSDYRGKVVVLDFWGDW